MESRDRRGRVRVAASVAAGLPLILVVVYGPARAEAHPGAETATGTVELDGKLRVIVEDAQHSSRTLYFLDTGSERLPLHFKSNPPTGFLTGQGVHVTGRRTDDTVEVPSGDSGIRPMTLPCCTSTSNSSTTTTSTSSATPTTLTNTFGAQNTLVIMVNFQDNTAQPWTASQVQSAVFGTVNSFFWEGSYGQTWLTGKVCGWYTIPLSSSTCDPNQIAAAAENAAAACANLSAYSRHVYAFPPANCSFGAEGTIGGNPSQAWLDGTIDTGIIAHELGHNFGLYHSHLLDCGTSILSGVCSVQEYGDLYDTMGGEDGHFNSFQKSRLGWLGSGVVPITTVTASGTYALDPYEIASTNPKALKIPKYTNPTTGLSTWYYVEYRQPIGFDSFFGSWTNSNVRRGVLIHIATDSTPWSSDALNMTPQTSTVEDVALVVGASYSDPDAGVTIKPMSATSSGASVYVSLSQPSCLRALPTVTLSPSQVGPVQAGTPVSFTASVTNNDGANCGPSTFNLQTAFAYLWTETLSPSALTVSPGATSSASLAVTSPPDAVTGPNPVGVYATNSADLFYNSSVWATYNVGASTNTTTSSTTTTTLGTLCLPSGATCNRAADCCSATCRGKSGRRTCK